ncbi:phd zinc finger-containing protein [Vairimorpha apis BRL 01]|uniref:Phd zinc finger-containing protein n=1 Tax=Vairimorpha apis BRL 01 TaxID=1037528 RepID=T0MCD8_9MICR|nr:phd zinc finger-containing protein [Vairimorpha apis BRL 01]
MGIFDTYDEVIENIQQIPLDVYILDKRNKRIEKKYVKIKNKIDILTKKALKGQQIDENEIMKLQYKFKKYKKNMINRFLNLMIIVKVGKNKSFGNKYCTCRQYACENMIACEEPSCKIQWFHFDCVGITLPPKNLWYCADCRKQKLV